MHKLVVTVLLLIDNIHFTVPNHHPQSKDELQSILSIVSAITAWFSLLNFYGVVRVWCVALKFVSLKSF